MSNMKYSVFVGALMLAILQNPTVKLTAQAKPNYDAIIQSACVSLPFSNYQSYSFAVPRDCSASTTCHSLCSGAKSSVEALTGHKFKRARCVRALHFYNADNMKGSLPKPTKNGKPIAAIWRYDTGCDRTNCGPNYCCCEGIE